MPEENWILFKNKKTLKSRLLHLENIYPENSIEHQVLAFSQLWLKNTSVFKQKSSGSTGSPKLYEIERGQMQASANATVQTLGLKAGDTALLNISPDFIGGKMMIVRALEHQINLIVGEVAADPLFHLTKQQKIDFFSFVPYQLAKIIEVLNVHSIDLLNKGKAIILGGAPVSESLALAIKKHLKTPVYSTYGMTETVSHIALKKINSEAETGFKALEGVAFSQDNRDCLVVHAPQVTGVESLTTNDVVQLTDKYHFEWLGRADFVINSGGIKLHPEQIEQKIEKLLKGQNILNQFFVFGQPDENLGTKLCLIVEGKIDKTEIKKIFQQSLAPYEAPKLIFETPSFSITKSDKLDRLTTLKNAGVVSS